MMRQLSRLVACQSCILLLLAAGCAGGTSDATPSTPGSGQPAVTDWSGALPLALPAPEVRGTTAATTTFRAGADYDAEPLSRVAPQPGFPSRAVYSPGVADGMPTVAEAAFAVYSFSLQNHDGDLRLSAGWEMAPDAGLAWIGLANWEAGAWQWFAMPAGGVLDPGATGLGPFVQPHGASAGLLQAAIVVAGADKAVLNWLSIGPAGGNRGGAWIHLGKIAAGVIDQRTGALYAGSSYTQGWSKVAAFSKFDALGNLEWNFDYDIDISCLIGGAAVDSSGAVYFAGRIYLRDDGKSKVLLLKFTPDGSLIWARTWFAVSKDSYGTDLAIDADDNLYISGFVYAYRYPVTEMDALLLKLTSDGALLWSTLWDSSNVSRFDCITLTAEGAPVVAGECLGFDFTGRDLLLIQFDPEDGEPAWTTVWGTEHDDHASDVACGPGGDIWLAANLESAARPATWIRFAAAGTLTEARSLWTPVSSLYADKAQLVMPLGDGMRLCGNSAGLHSSGTGSLFLLDLDHDGSITRCSLWGSEYSICWFMAAAPDGSTLLGGEWYSGVLPVFPLDSWRGSTGAALVPRTGQVAYNELAEIAHTRGSASSIDFPLEPGRAARYAGIGEGGQMLLKIGF